MLNRAQQFSEPVHHLILIIEVPGARHKAGREAHDLAWPGGPARDEFRGAGGEASSRRNVGDLNLFQVVVNAGFQVAEFRSLSGREILTPQPPDDTRQKCPGFANRWIAAGEQERRIEAQCQRAPG